MNLAEKLKKYFEELPEIQKRKVIDSVEFMKSKSQNSLEVMMNEMIFENKEALEELAK